MPGLLMLVYQSERPHNQKRGITAPPAVHKICYTDFPYQNRYPQKKSGYGTENSKSEIIGDMSKISHTVFS